MLEALSGALKDIAKGFRLAPLWWRLGLEHTMARFQRSILGPFWLSANLLATAFALSFVFGGLLGSSYRSNFPLIISGILVWSLIGTLVAEAGSLFLSNSGTIQNNGLPLSFYVFLHIQKGLVNFAAQAVALFAVLAVLKMFVVPSWIIIPGLIVCIINTAFLSLIVAIPSTRYRDVGFMLGFILQIAFFVTPVFWAPSQMNAKRRFIVDYNPLAHELELIRQPLLGKTPALIHWEWGIGMMVVLAIIGIIVLVLYRKRVIFWL